MGSVIGTISLVIAWNWFDWKLALVLFLLLLGNNMSKFEQDE